MTNFEPKDLILLKTSYCHDRRWTRSAGISRGSGCLQPNLCRQETYVESERVDLKRLPSVDLELRAGPASAPTVISGGMIVTSKADVSLQ